MPVHHYFIQGKLFQSPKYLLSNNTIKDMDMSEEVTAAGEDLSVEVALVTSGGMAVV